MGHVCMVIPNWNGWEDTIECLNSVFKLERIEDLLIVIVDNASTNDSVEKISEWVIENIGLDKFLFLNEKELGNNIKINNKEIVLVQKDKNNGFAGAVNAGIRLGLKYSQFQYYWILNNDTVVDRLALAELLNYTEVNKGKYSVIGNTILEYNDPEVIQCAGGCYYNTLLTINKPYLKGEHVSKIYEDTLETKDFSYINGASLFVPAHTFNSIGVLNEEYFLYYEELDLVQRSKDLELSLGWCKKSLLYHKGGSSAGSKSAMNKRKSGLSEYYSNLSALKYTQKYHKNILVLVAISRFLLKSLMFLKQREWRLFKALCRSYYDFGFKKNRSYNS